MYQALYRQYRPRRFDDVLGQDHIISTIKNQIKSDNIGHAYLFSGTRGTGKTSTAKIFSRAVNCLNPVDSSPCNECEICLGILDGSIMDVIEMDAASNRGVNDIRELRDKVVYPPSHGRYKVYIIDEVHMLTQEAFNALLKTLEEPPKHLIFILATTEPERIPQTILSRCQRFDFKRISTDDIIKNMKAISEKLGVQVEERALRVIARNADGGMRDALSLLDQALSHSSGDIKYEDAIAILGIVNLDTVFKMVDNILDKSTEDILISIDEFMEEGRDVNQFIKDIISHFRDLMIVKTSREAEKLIPVDPETMSRYREQAERIELDYLLKILEILTDIDDKSKLSSQPRTLLEMGMIRIVKGKNLSLEERVRRLEEGVSLPVEGQAKLETTRKKEAPKEGKSNPPKKISVREPEREEVRTSLPASDLSIESVRQEWENLLARIRKEKPNVSGVLIEGNPREINNGILIVEFGEDYGFHMNAAENNKDYIVDSLKKHFSSDLDIRFVMEDPFTSQEEDKKKDDFKTLDRVKNFFGEDRVIIE